MRQAQRVAWAMPGTWRTPPCSSPLTRRSTSPAFACRSTAARLAGDAEHATLDWPVDLQRTAKKVPAVQTRRARRTQLAALSNERANICRNEPPDCCQVSEKLGGRTRART